MLFVKGVGTWPGIFLLSSYKSFVNISIPHVSIRYKHHCWCRTYYNLSSVYSFHRSAQCVFISFSPFIVAIVTCNHIRSSGHLELELHRSKHSMRHSFLLAATLVAHFRAMSKQHPRCLQESNENGLTTTTGFNYLPALKHCLIRSPQDFNAGSDGRSGLKCFPAGCFLTFSLPRTAINNEQFD